MRFHMHLLPTYFPDRDPPFDVYYQQVLEQIALAEELGWECFWFTEHHFLLYGGPMPNPAAIMCAAAARTSQIHLGSAISILPLHHPVEVAENYAMVDVVSGGRLEFGIGLGNTTVDFQVYGVPREESRDRFEEAAEVVLKAWTNERFNHEGRFWQFKDVPVYPRPVQQPTPTHLGCRSLARVAWLGGSPRLQHHDRGPSVPAGALRAGPGRLA
jgi:alkanesulfonate monooxygenase SsuD/methylene tetrahydromethanopterin reductase-like flavin-dependent oxidoreductase (luciferase family)